MQRLAVKRSIRIGEDLARHIALILQKTVKDPRVHGVTITGVKISDDLRNARVFYSLAFITGQTTYSRKEIQKGLESATGFIKKEIGRVMQLRLIPQIRFYYDDTIQSAERIESLIDEIHKE